MTYPRMRLAAIASSVALSMSVGLAPVAVAQDGPEAPMNEVLAAFSEGRFADATVPFCAELEGVALGGLGQLDEMLDSGLGYDLGLVFDALRIDTSGLQVAVAEEGTDSALLDVTGTIDVGVDEDGLVALLSVMLGEGDEPLDEEIVRGVMLPMMEEQIDAMLGGSVEVEEQIQVVLEDGAWQVCDDLQAIGDALAGVMGAPASEATPEPLEPEASDDTAADGTAEEEASEDGDGA